MRSLIEQATDRAHRALRELDAAAAILAVDEALPVGRWVDEARQATQGAVRVLDAHRATALLRRRSVRPR